MITGQAKEDKISLHQKDLTIETVEVAGQARPFTVDDANEAAYNWISLELSEEDCSLPSVSDISDMNLKEGDIVRNISVNIRFYEGWDE